MSEEQYRFFAAVVRLWILVWVVLIFVGTCKIQNDIHAIRQSLAPSSPGPSFSEQLDELDRKAGYR